MSIHEYDPWTDVLRKHAQRRRRTVVRRVLRGVLALACVAALAAGVVFGLPALRRAGNGQPAALATALPTGQASGEPSGQPSATPDPGVRQASADPYAGTAAARFATGADGIVLPAAAATGRFTAAEVDTALRKSKEYMTVAYLDPRVYAGDEDVVFALLGDRERKAVQKWMAADPADHSRGLAFFAHFAPGVTLMVPDVRVDGTVTFAIGSDSQELEIHANQVYVYPLRRGSEAALVIVHRDMIFRFYKTGSVRAGEEGPYLGGGRGSLYWDEDCDAMNNGLLAPSHRVSSNRPAPGTPDYSERFDPSQPIAGADDCGLGHGSQSATPAPQGPVRSA
ncbi:hypothetical protein [Frankia sp. Cr2]|uniref:hypothetical protein n=1 Tax=Frankia sp. Cr2 TaxID=3073932 RepID=UPI002AD37607|nr:hypothetical protein [Frankia sp. Cr2]